MPRKQRLRPLVKVDPAAFSIRSDAMSCVTVLFDESNLKKLNQANFDLSSVAFQQAPKKQHDKLRRWAGRGTWMAVASHPDVLDSDGVPSLDLVFLNSKSNRSSKAKKIKPPAGLWFDPVKQLLDLPSGRLRVVYEDQFFCKGFDQNEDVCLVESPNDGVPTATGFAESSSYLISCVPGLYLATVFTRFVDSMEDTEIEGAADLAVFLAPTTKPASFRMSVPLLPIHPSTQDVAALRRSAGGMPEKDAQAISKPKLLKDGDFQTSITYSEFAISLEMPETIRNKFGYEPGLLLTLEVEGMSIRGVAVENETPDPSIWDLIEREKKKPGSFVTFEPFQGSLILRFIKKSPRQKLNLVTGETVPATLRFQKDELGQPLKIALKQSAAQHKDAVKIPNRLGKPGKKVAKLYPKMEKCFAWKQCCVFELNGSTMMAVVNVCPPQYQTVGGKKKRTMAEEITAMIATYAKGYPSDERTKRFRKFPEGIDKAFAWVAKEMKGGWLWTNRFELDLDFWNTKISLKQKECESDAIAAWLEVLGME